MIARIMLKQLAHPICDKIPQNSAHSTLAKPVLLFTPHGVASY